MQLAADLLAARALQDRLTALQRDRNRRPALLQEARGDSGCVDVLNPTTFGP